MRIWAIHALHILIKRDTSTFDVTFEQRFQKDLEKLSRHTQDRF